MWNKIKGWWSKKTNKQRKGFILYSIVAILVAMALMSLGSAIQFSIEGFNFLSLLYIAIGVVIGYFIGKNSSDEDEEENNKEKKNTK